MTATERIVEALVSIPSGHVVTYGDVAPRTPRLVGHVLATHHDDRIPWWRVVRADGTLSQGEDQRRLLEQEDVPFLDRDDPTVDLASARRPPA